jgi:predicted O-methyltransferase YrrM
MFDNVLWKGFVADEKKREEDLFTKTLYQVVQNALNDARF